MVSRNDGKKAGRSGLTLGLGAGALVVCVAMILYGVFGTPPLRDHTADDSGDKPQNTAVTTETATNAAAKDTKVRPIAVKPMVALRRLYMVAQPQQPRVSISPPVQ